MGDNWVIRMKFHDGVGVLIRRVIKLVQCFSPPRGVTITSPLVNQEEGLDPNETMLATLILGLQSIEL